jgi:hypothetical protein
VELIAQSEVSITVQEAVHFVFIIIDEFSEAGCEEILCAREPQHQRRVEGVRDMVLDHLAKFY